MSFSNPLKISFILLSIFLIPFSAQAALVSTSLQGTVTADNGGANPFGLSNGNSVSASATYDDSVVQGNSMSERIFLQVPGRSGWDFTITLGSFSFSLADVANDPAYTSFFFNNGRLDGIRFIIDSIDIAGVPNILLKDFNASRSLFAEDATSHNPVYLEVNWDFVNATTPTPVSTSAVPVPAAFWLFFSGIIGLLGMKKQRNNRILAS